MYDLKGLETHKTGLSYTNAHVLVKNNVSLVMRRPIHFITARKSEGGGRKLYGYGVSKRLRKGDLGRYWLTPMVHKGGETLHTIEPALHSVPKISDDDMYKEDWEILFIKRWNDVSINDCD